MVRKKSHNHVWGLVGVHCTAVGVQWSRVDLYTCTYYTLVLKSQLIYIQHLEPICKWVKPFSNQEISPITLGVNANLITPGSTNIFRHHRFTELKVHWRQPDSHACLWSFSLQLEVHCRPITSHCKMGRDMTDKRLILEVNHLLMNTRHSTETFIIFSWWFQLIL